MLSSQSEEIRPKHERQMSMPMIYPLETDSSYFPATYHPGFNQHSASSSHRRGTSLDQSMRPQDSAIITPGNGMVSTNQGLYEQQTMRETQMRGLPRPGPYNGGLDNIFEDPSTIGQQEKNFGSFGSLGFDDSFSSGFGPTFNPAISQSIQSPIAYSRPQTPQNQMLKDAFSNNCSSLSRPPDPIFSQSSPIRHGSIDLSMQPIAPSMKRGSSYQEVVAMKRSQSQSTAIESAPNTVPLRSCATFDTAPMPTADFLDITGLNFDFTLNANNYESSNYSPTQTSPAISSRRSSPDLPPATLFGELVNDGPYFPRSQHPSAPSSPAKTRASSPRKKAQQLPEEMTIEDTGITTEQVEAFISQPDPQTAKYKCLYEGCKMGPFGRKENIRAHVQTHLGDRKYVCTVCSNKFVRPNDLKRHAIIHQETKEYTCKCGAAFGRQDALRRHRIRKPFCVDGDPSLELMRREEKKRGRPRKIAPLETNERRQRKETIRKEVMAKKRNESIEPSAGGSPRSRRSVSPQALDPRSGAQSYSPTNMSLTPPASPEADTDDVFDSRPATLPSQINHASLSPPPTRGSITTGFAHDDMVFSNDSPFNVDTFGPSPFSPSLSRARSSPSNYGTPPELDLSSSPPASRFALDLNDALDADFTSQLTNFRSINNSTTGSSATTFSDDFFSDDKLMDDLIKDCGGVTSSSRTESFEDVENFLFLDNI